MLPQLMRLCGFRNAGLSSDGGVGSPARVQGFEVAMLNLVRTLQASKREGASPADRLALVHDGMEKLVTAFVKDNLETCSNIKYNSELVQSLLSADDLEDPAFAANPEYAIRNHLRNIIRAYISVVNQHHPVKASDRTQLGLHLESIGLSFGFSSDASGKRIFCRVVVLRFLSVFILLCLSTCAGTPRSYLPDGNVLALCLVTCLVVVLAFMRK